MDVKTKFGFKTVDIEIYTVEPAGIADIKIFNDEESTYVHVILH